ncbi:RNHCP domain-containing protein [Candidatus Gracilibacteria bacterium]|nr:RNHCP domain-containing protein [Candidatus Gracilibacteria bacterium]
MRPLGLTTKLSRNKYARERDGELMIIHGCTGCGELVINRIAADDDSATILDLVERAMAECDILAIEQTELQPLGAHDRALIERRLFGR